MKKVFNFLETVYDAVSYFFFGGKSLGMNNDNFGI